MLSGPHSLAINFFQRLAFIQNVVQDNDEGCRWLAAQNFVVGRGEVALRLQQEGHQLVIGEVADAPPEHNAIVLGLPEVRLHSKLVN